MYKNESIIKKAIIEEARHHFIVSPESNERTEFIESIERENPIRLDTAKPSAIYLPVYGLPNTKNGLDTYKKQIISSEYLSFLIITRILENSKNNIDNNELNKRIKNIINYINERYINSPSERLTDINDLQNIMKKSLNYHYNNFTSMSGNDTENANDIPIPFIELTSFIQKYKKVLNNTGHINILIDNKQCVDYYSVMAINQLTSSRSNDIISTKIFSEMPKWPTYKTDNNQFIEPVHDYGILKLEKIIK